MRVDVDRDGRRWLTGQQLGNTAMWTRVRQALVDGHRLELRPQGMVPAPIPPPTGLAEDSRSVLFFAQVTDDAVLRAAHLPARWRFALSADPAYAPTAAQVSTLTHSGHPVDAWGVQTQIGAGTILDFAAEYGLACCIFQSETVSEYASVPPGRGTVGNPNAWTAAQRADAIRRVANGELAVIAEVYNGRPDTYSSQGVPVSSLCLGVALDGGVHYPLEMLLARTPAGARGSFSVWHAAGLDEADWRAMMAA